MISRRTALILGECYQVEFTRREAVHGSRGGHITGYQSVIQREALYDFLFEQGYEAWFCNRAKGLYGRFDSERQRVIKEFIMKLHTGETTIEATPDWTQEQRCGLGQRYLRDLAKDILESKKYQLKEEQTNELLGSLELDGYTYQDGQLLFSESDVLDVQEEKGILETLYGRLALQNSEVTFNHLELSEQHYLSGLWGDTISNSRNFLENVLREVAQAHSLHNQKVMLPDATYRTARLTRDYLEAQGLLEKKEKEALSAVYGLLSETGSHPNMAHKDQARLMRHLALTFAQFVMLRYQGYLNAAGT